jgi:ATP-dependent DNA helicase RecG
LGDPAIELERALDALEKPLRFASRGEFENLDRVRGLAATLRGAAERARVLIGEDRSAALDALIGAIPADDARRDERVAGLKTCLSQVERLRGAGKVETPAPRPEPGRRLARPPIGGEARGSASGPPVKQLDLDASVQFIRGVGPRIAELLSARGLNTVEDLLRFLPRRYEDRRGQRSIADLVEGSVATVEARVMAKSQRTLRGKRTLEVAVGDATGVLHLKWFRVPGKTYADRFVRGRHVRVSGHVKRYRGALEMVHPETAVTGSGERAGPVEDAIVPIYADVEGVRPVRLRQIVDAALPSAWLLDDLLPAALAAKRDLPSLAESIRALHRPEAGAPLDDLHGSRTPWHRRLIYEELLIAQLAVLRRKARAAREPGLAMDLAGSLAGVAHDLFPFEMTGAQRRVLGEIEADLRRSVPMSRLLQGDVGSGKTAVAVAACAAVAQAGHQAAIMAPTEILAEQHARVALETLSAAGFRVGLLTGNVAGSERRRILEDLGVGRIQVIVGTHALIQEEVHFARLALGIVDEQHRFGVRQRARIVELGREGLGRTPHMLVMTATPIPRTLALTVYGDLDLSLLDELPPGRTPVATRLFGDKQREQAYRRVRREVERGRQAYVVFPLVEGSDAEGLERIRDATSSAEALANGPLAGLTVGLLHGRMGGDEKDATMRRFIAGEIQVLVSTTVIEVGIDVPNATVMVIEHAERFGLSQLHQLRGRVGRGEHESVCLLLSHYTPSEDAWRRLKVMEKTNDGFLIAEEDLAIRGPGDFLGTRQSGMPLLAVANLARDQRILQQAREDAAELLNRDPDLEAEEHRALRGSVATAWQERLALAQIG